MSRIVRSAAARRDLAEILLYIARHDEDAAWRLADRLGRRLLLLADNPRLGQSRVGGIAGLRSFTLSPYVLLYRPLPDGIRLIRVLHGARDIAAELSDD